MAISTYSQLQAAVANAVNRDDLSADVTAFSPVSIDGLIKQSIATATKSIEADFLSRGSYKAMETVTNALTTTAGVETVTLPTDFASSRVFMLLTNPNVVLEFVDPNTLFTQYPNDTPGQPQKYTIIGTNTAYLRPVPQSTTSLRLVYAAQIPVLSDSNTTNWLLTARPDVYINRSMVELAITLENEDRAQWWKGLYDQAINDLMGDDRNTRWAAVPAKPNLQVTIA